MILLRASVRHLLRHPWQAALSVLGIALGVAVVVSVDLSSASARRAFALSAEGVTGRATHQVVGGPAGLDERVVGAAHPRGRGRIRWRRWSRRGWASRARRAGRSSCSASIRSARRRSARTSGRGEDARGAGAGTRALGTLVTEPGAVLLSRETAAELGVGVSGTLVLRVSGRLAPGARRRD